MALYRLRLFGNCMVIVLGGLSVMSGAKLMDLEMLLCGAFLFCAGMLNLYLVR